MNDQLQEDRRRKQIQLSVAALCVDCRILYDISESHDCPNCGTASGLMAVESVLSRKPRKRKERQ